MVDWLMVEHESIDMGPDEVNVMDEPPTGWLTSPPSSNRIPLSSYLSEMRINANMKLKVYVKLLTLKL